MAMTPSRARRMLRDYSVFLASIAPDAWLDWGLEDWKGKGLTVQQVIALRASYCLATNAKYQNSDLFKETFSRIDGKTKLIVEHKRNDNAGDDESVDGLTDDELHGAVQEMREQLDQKLLEDKGGDARPTRDAEAK